MAFAHMRRPARRRRTGPRGSVSYRSPHRRSSLVWCYVFVALSLVLAIMFTFWPMAVSWYYSLLDWTGFLGEKTFLGLGNYFELVKDQQFWNAFKNSFFFIIAAVPIRLVLTLIVAILLNDRMLKLSPIFRTFFFIPVITTTAIIGILMTFLLSPSNNGPVDQILVGIGVVDNPVGFLTDPSLALWTVMGVSVWKHFGVTMVYWLAALQSIPSELYEAAKIDGASTFKMHLGITVPLLKIFAIIIIVITAANTLQIFDLVQTMTGGGPYFATEVMEVFIYRTAFSVLGGGVPRLGYASAAGVFFGVTVMVLALFQGWATRRVGQLRRDLGAGRR